MKIDWNDSTSQILINPRYSQGEKDLFSRIPCEGKAWPGHIWVATSGSKLLKWVALSKAAILSSASAVNDHLMSSSKDIWIHALPDFHIGGVGIWARAFLTGAKVSDYKAYAEKWDPHAFCAFVETHQGTLSALVPAQVHDLILAGLRAPESLRAIVIGGGNLSDEVYRRGGELGWSLLPSYGMTECASQIATATPGDPTLTILPHISVKIGAQGELCFKGPSLLSAYAYCSGNAFQFIDPKVDGWFHSEDRGTIWDGKLQVLGRLDQMVKIGGESVDVARLEGFLEAIRLELKISYDMALVVMPDSRLGSVIQLATTSSAKEYMNTVIEQFNQRVLPFERIREINMVPYIPRSALSKVAKAELLQLINRCRPSSVDV